MTPSAIFCLTRNGEAIHQIQLGQASVRGETLVDVNEMQPYGFEIQGRESETEYAVWIGDISSGLSQPSALATQGVAVGIPRGRYVLWDDGDYFEGARGIIWIRVASRTHGGQEPWSERAELPVVVCSTKLSEHRYQAMYDQLRHLASGLVLDLVSKSLRSVRLGGSATPVSCRSSIVELRILERLWPPIAAAINEIALNPVRRLQSTRLRKRCFGSERFGPRALVQMTATGFDPRQARQFVPFLAEVQQIVESDDTIEHRVIRGFLEFLERRLAECRENLQRHMRSIASDRRWRDRSVSGQPSLYEIEDIPRLARLREQLRRTKLLGEQVGNAKRIEALRTSAPIFRIADTPVFRNVEPYRRIQQEMIRYLTTGLVIIDEGFDERIKSTSRMYEQWVFLQLAAAIRAVGLPCRSRNGLLHTTRMFRFTLDIDRGARVTFDAGPNRSVSLRYEPWILPEHSAKQSMETVYRGRSGQSSWCPDILLEVLRNDEARDKPSDVEYAVVIDAKYAAAIRDHHWDKTNKYLEIRSARTDRQVVRQLWLAHPREEPVTPIRMRDLMLKWTDAGPNCGKDETVQGVLSLVPSAHLAREEESPAWIRSPEPVVLQFVAGLLNYLNIPNKSANMAIAYPE